ncbi:phosphoadenosine phosphosulfate reductase family protein (plasmid) [Citrobacter freundii]|uniref:phosphoadenosine phosphosulfate reductase family protein n=1 Tax=Citrobacter freundii TaxID=546 RepID=UPI00174D505C|nr:phosphoadenosine phosphosulfate reductase family protein [Citrobacter freundii]HCP9940431.1 phosphoadenosine phosphosulfate reductase family protein [Escherichia coli]QMI78317.1 phosphoadenosine phosphosulfate reductase family protein [Citrobacter freundii]UDV25249.1 phosphoadenosine phosphosulfate reductase family protein [Citrobacter freundii]HCQ0040608.1 phosphoadenosine phosphosulfate reductase family protein [Escherichia coli]HCQ0086058.1 phosphoadenosine phosphosulfate reductase famil
MQLSHAEAVIFKNDKWDNALSVLNTHPDLIAIEPGREQSLGELVTSSVESIYTALTSGWTMMLGYSSGKDSEALLHLFLMALIRAVRSGAVTSRHHFLLHTDTLVENPEVHWLARKKLTALQTFIDTENLPLTIVLGQPSVTSSWTGRILTGRGLPTFTNSNARQCTHELKISAAQRAKAEYMRGKRIKGRVCLMLGSRDAEGSTRAGNIAKKNGSAVRVIKKHGGDGELYPVKNWLASDIWEFLLSSGSSSHYHLPSYLVNNNETAEMYRSATGECVWSAQDKRQSDSCGARFGCWSCQAVGLDKSMQTLLSSNPDRYGYMEYLNRLQRFLAKRRYAWEDRHPVGRTIYGNGYIKIQPDVYSPQFLERLLFVCCSIDYVEQCRADALLDQLVNGEIENTEHNRRMAEPQFRIVTEAALIHIDFMWGFHHFNSQPFRALDIYHKVWTFGMTDLLDDEPDMMPVERTPIPYPLWVKVSKWGDDSLFSGLADPMAEMTYFNGTDDPRVARTILTPAGSKHVVDFCDEDELTVDPYSAEFIVWEEYPRLRAQVRDGILTPGSAAQFYLRFGVIQISAGKAAMYDRMMERGQTLHRLKLSGQQTMSEIAKRKDLRVLEDKKFRWVTAKTIQARMIQMKWWCCMFLVLSQYMDEKGRFRPVLVFDSKRVPERAA